MITTFDCWKSPSREGGASHLLLFYLLFFFSPDARPVAEKFRLMPAICCDPMSTKFNRRYGQLSSRKSPLLVVIQSGGFQVVLAFRSFGRSVIVIVVVESSFWANFDTSQLTISADAIRRNKYKINYKGFQRCSRPTARRC